MLGYRLRRWPNIKSALGQCVVFTGKLIEYINKPLYRWIASEYL